MKKNKIAIVEIKGGFGNQIFQLAFANYLKSNKFKVYLNIQKDWNLNHVISYKDFGFRSCKKYILVICKLFYKISERHKFRWIFNKFLNKRFAKYFKLSHLENLGSKKLNHFDGYWQDLDLIEGQKEFIVSSLSKNDVYLKAFKKSIGSGTTLFHVRRGDYVDIGENLSINFYESALNFCKKNIKNFNFDVFTDDLEWVRSQTIFKDAKNIYGPSKDYNLETSLICKMINFENYVIGNSTFSLIPAILSKTEKSKLIVSDPRFKHSDSDLKFNEAWTKIQNF